ncbi:hypothetical protein L596_008640 [Steinernema carpocapsae]|uniref:Uncharacterized protein n=1 Tax=Steinernema carpocapsae TaxID=34508 RepID=A0A4U5PDE1_STECR|nr:hypothetical protein L596_008640 [Steinernema carpocapsae]
MEKSGSSTASKPSLELSTVGTRSSKSAALSLQPSSCRLGVTLLLLGTIAALLLAAHAFLTSPSGGSRLLGGILVLLVGYFAFTWMQLHSFGLTRKRRAWFDESNILETYQPRARTIGHLFHPDPPTPSPFPTVKISEPTDPEMHTNAEKAAFNANRDAHYANMFEQAMRMNRELEAAECGAKKEEESSTVATDVTQTSARSNASGSQRSKKTS